MDGVAVAGLVVAGVGTVAGIAGAWYARAAVVPKRRARRAAASASSSGSPSGGAPMPSTYDVFVSYSHADADWVRPFAERLEREGVHVAYDEVVLKPGDKVVHTLQQAILDSAHGLLVYSKASKASGWVDLEYETLIQQTTRTGQRFIPLLIEDVELPLFAQNFFYSDFRNVTRKQYDERIADLVKALRP
jgi:TIR domain